MDLSSRFQYTQDYQALCSDTLDMALRDVPVYRRYRRFDPGHGASADERFAAMPVLNKAVMRASFPDGLMPVTQDRRAGLESGEIEYSFTSGTTGDKVVNIFSTGWWQSAEAAAWKLNGRLAALTYPQREAKLASSLNVGISCEEDLPMTMRTVGHTLYLNEKTSLIQWQQRHYARMIRELNEFRPVILEANPSLLARLAYWAEDHGAAVFSPAVIVFSYEFTSQIHLNAIRRVFTSSLVSSYGTTETGFVLEQCESGLLHQNTRFCRIDYEPLLPEAGGPEVGRLYVTTFGNPWNVIIKFDTGDLVRLHATGRCSCGRGEGLLADAVEGRVSNLTFDACGKPVTTKKLDDRLAQIPGLRDYSLVQRTPAKYELQILAPRETESAVRECTSALAEVYGSGDFCVTAVLDLLPGPAGKYRRTRTSFPFAEEKLFEEK